MFELVFYFSKRECNLLSNPFALAQAVVHIWLALSQWLNSFSN